MQLEQFKILRAARAMGDFTKPELIARAGVKDQALRSVFRRHGDELFEKTGVKRRMGQKGKSAEVWCLRSDRIAEIDGLVDAGRTLTHRKLIDPSAAAKAMNDDHARWQARTSLFDAVDAKAGPSRDLHLHRVHKWIAHEERRLRHWGVAVEAPEHVIEDFRELRRRARAVEYGVDLLATASQVSDLPRAMSWMIQEGWRYNEHDPDAFAPLELRRADDHAEALAEAALLGPEFDGIPRERLVIAAIAALPNMGIGPARVLICGMLDKLGEKVGYALDEALSQARPSGREEAQRMMLPVLMGFQSFPELLKRPCFATARRWFDNLPWSRDWDPALNPFWAALARHTHKNSIKVRLMLSAEPRANSQSTRERIADMRAMVGFAPDAVWRAVERKVELYDSPPEAPRRGADWLTGQAVTLFP